MANSELLQKVVQTSQIGAGGGGILNAKQANRFLDYVVEQSVLVKDARVIRMNEPTQDIDKTTIGRRIMRKATEAVDDGVNADPTFTKISLTTVKVRLDWELSTEGLEDNIEGRSLEDHVASIMARQTANDLEDLFIHGDTADSDPLLKSLDGWRKRARADAVVVDAAGDNLTRSTFDRALRNLPNKYLQRRSALKWYTSSSLVQDYIWSLTLTNSTAGLDGTGASAPGSTYGDLIVNAGAGAASGGAVGSTGLRPFGIPLWEIPLLEETEAGDYSGATGNHGVLELTFPENRLIGIQREIVVYREFKPKKDTIEYTQFVRIANQIENEEAFVHVKNVAVRAF
jgi:hypothetical protein